MTGLMVRPADAYAALRVIADGAKAAAEVVLEENVVPAAEAMGATTFTTPFGKVYTSTSEAHVEILSSADLRAWLKTTRPDHPDHGQWTDGVWIIPEHDEDTFDEHQLRRAVKVLEVARWTSEVHTPEDLALAVLRAAFPPRTVPERIAEWVIPYLTQRAKIVTWEEPGPDETHPDRGRTSRLVVVDSETGEEWPWATAVPKKVTWNGRFDKEKKADAAGLILDQVNQFAALVGVKEIGS